MNSSTMFNHVLIYMGSGGSGGLQDFSVSHSPLGTNWGLELGWPWGVWGLGVRGLGTELDTSVSFLADISVVWCVSAVSARLSPIRSSVASSRSSEEKTNDSCCRAPNINN